MSTHLLTINEAAERLGCSRNHCYRLIASGELRAVDIAPKTSQKPKTRVRDDDLTSYIDRKSRSARRLRAAS